MTATTRSNREDDGRYNPLPDRGIVLTRKGLIAAICAAAEPYDWTRRAGDQEEA